MKHSTTQKYSAARRILNSLLSVSSGNETLGLMPDISSQLARPSGDSVVHAKWRFRLHAE